MTDHDRASNRAGNPPLYSGGLTNEEIAEMQRNMQLGHVQRVLPRMTPARVAAASEYLHQRETIFTFRSRLPAGTGLPVHIALMSSVDTVDGTGTIECGVQAPADLLRAFLKRCDDDLVKELREIGVDVAYLED